MEDVQRRESFRARRLSVERIPGHVRIVPGSGSDLTVELEGPEKLVDQIAREVHGDTLEIGRACALGGSSVILSQISGVRGHSFARVSCGGSSVAVSGSGNVSVRVDGDNLMVVSGDDVSVAEGVAGRVAMTVTVPAGTPLAIRACDGETYEIGDTAGPIDVRAKDRAKVTVGRVGDAVLRASDSGVVEVASVVGRTLEARADDHGRVEVGDGRTETVALTGKSRGAVSMRGSADSAELIARDGGRVQLDVTAALRSVVMIGRDGGFVQLAGGAAQADLTSRDRAIVHVDGGAEHVSATARDGARAFVEGGVQHLTATARDGGRVVVDRVTGSVSEQVRGRGRVEIGERP